MGLDITAYSHLAPAPDAAMEDGQPIEWLKYFAVSQQEIDWTEKNWPGRTCGIQPGVYSFAESYRFPAGPYSRHSAFRRALAKFASLPPVEEIWAQSEPRGPFVELINFADNEGIIGAEIAAKLANDFRNHFGRTLTYQGPDREWFVTLYRNWMRAFELAADSGAVDFH